MLFKEIARQLVGLLVQFSVGQRDVPMDDRYFAGPEPGLIFNQAVDGALGRKAHLCLVALDEIALIEGLGQGEQMTEGLSALVEPIQPVQEDVKVLAQMGEEWMIDRADRQALAGAVIE